MHDDKESKMSDGDSPIIDGNDYKSEEDLSPFKGGDQSQEGSSFDTNKAASPTRKRVSVERELSADNIEFLELEEVKSNKVVKFSSLYKYLNFLGRGGFGYVISCIHRASGMHVALKIVDTRSSNAVKCVRREAQVLQELPTHQNVVGFMHI